MKKLILLIIGLTVLQIATFGNLHTQLSFSALPNKSRALASGSLNAIDTIRPNGWYYVTSGQQDSLSAAPIVTVTDFEQIRLDSTTSIMQGGETVYQITGKVKDNRVKTWADATEQSKGKCIAFVHNNRVITNPMVNARIESGNFAISSFDGTDMKTLYKDILEEMKNAEIDAENKKAWTEVRKY